MNNNPNPSFALLVGSHFVPPAKTLLKALRPGTRVELVPEPENLYDSEAIKVYLASEEGLAWDELRLFAEELGGSGMTVEDIEARFASGESFALGHVGASGGKPLVKLRAKYPGLIGTKELQSARSGLLRFNGTDILIEVREADGGETK